MVLSEAGAAGEGAIKLLQEHVKSTIAPYKYPRAIAFIVALPRTQTGKVQRYVLREREVGRDQPSGSPAQVRR